MGHCLRNSACVFNLKNAIPLPSLCWSSVLQIQPLLPNSCSCVWYQKIALTLIYLGKLTFLRLLRFVDTRAKLVNVSILMNHMIDNC